MLLPLISVLPAQGEQVLFPDEPEQILRVEASRSTERFILAGEQIGSWEEMLKVMQFCLA